MSDNQYETITEFEDEEEDLISRKQSRQKFIFNMRSTKIELLRRELMDLKAQFAKDKRAYVKRYQMMEAEKNKAQTALEECLQEKNTLIKDLIKTSTLLEIQQNRLRELQKQVDFYNKNTPNLVSDIDLKKEISKLKEKADNLEAEKAKLKVEMEGSKNFICKLTHSLKEAHTRNSELFETVKRLNEDNDHLRKENTGNGDSEKMDETKRMLHKKEEEINKLKGILKKTPPSIGVNKSTQANFIYEKMKIEEMITKQNQLVEVIDICEKQIHLLFKKLNNLQKENEKLSFKKTTDEEKIKELQENCLKANEKAIELENTVISLNEKAIHKDVESEELKSRLQRMEDVNKNLTLQIEQKEAKTQKMAALYEKLLKMCSASEKSAKNSNKNTSSSENSLQSFNKNRSVLLVPRKILGEFEREINTSKTQIEELKFRVKDFNEMQTKVTTKLNDTVQNLKTARQELTFYKSKYENELEKNERNQQLMSDLRKMTTSMRERFQRDVKESQNLCNTFMQQIVELEKESVALAEKLKIKEIELEECKDNEKKFEGVINNVKQEAISAATSLESWKKMAMNLFDRYISEIRSISVCPERILSNINQVEEEIRQIERAYKSKKLLTVIDQT